MLTHRNAQMFFLFLTATLIFAHWQYGISLYWLCVLLFLYLSIAFIGSNYIQLNYFIKSFNNGNVERKGVALTFDDGPTPQYTQQVLDILNKENVKATFFLIGHNIEGNEALVKRMYNEGHAIGNHSYSHNFWFSMKPSAEMTADLKKCDTKIEEAIGHQPKLFRPPYGVTNPMVAKAIEQGGYKSIGWSLRTYDTTAKSKEQLLSKILNNVKNGDVILLHDWAPYTVGTLSEIINGVRSKGLEIVKVDELLGLNAYN